ncbi:M20/M25/M40 family metallo-hydrolase [Lentzea sp. NPDC051208]|uniref:M20/M25/M40 family metallo-hydrolase n=1 Tax=Lentzea sp. NPDC051208 TaxID=3154642 RepID=UPI003421E0BC
MNDEALLELLQRCITTHSPSGREKELSDLVRQELDAFGIPHTTDAAGNVIARFPRQADESSREDAAGGAVLCVAHMDEIGMVVKTVGEDGRLVVNELGTAFPWKYGEGPVDVLGDREVVTGVFSCGSAHVGTVATALGGAAVPSDWTAWWVETKQSAESLRSAGVRPGSKVVPGRARKMITWIGDDHISGFALDDKAGVAVLLAIALRLRDEPPANDTVLAFTCNEETGAAGAAWLAAELRPRTMIALEVAPNAPEYGVVNDGRPVLFVRDWLGPYSEDVVAELQHSAAAIEVDPQYWAGWVAATDSSVSTRAGHAARSAVVAFPTDNTHGWEITSWASLCNVRDLLVHYLTSAASSHGD